MIQVSRSLIRELKTVFSRGLGITSRQTGPPVEFLVDQRQLRIRTRNQQVALEYRTPVEGLEIQQISAPFGLLRCCHGPKADPVQIQRQEKAIQVEWQEAGIPQSMEYPTAECREFPALPDELDRNESRLMEALRDACETATDDSARYALDHLQLRGVEGQVISTDGRQLLVQEDFQFPWEGELLIPVNRLLCCRELRRGKSVEIGRTAEWVTLRSGPWTIWLRINEKARFPDVMELVNQSPEAVASLQIPDEDAEFICAALKPKPFHQDDAGKVTLDLNGEVTVCAREAGQGQQRNYVLCRSERSGESLRANTSRDYFRRALQLGFREISLSGSDTPACCRDEYRIYVWALLTQAETLQSQPDAVRIESTSVAPPKTRSRTKQKRVTERVQSEQKQAVEAEQVLTQMKSLCGGLTETVSHIRDLMAQLHTQSQGWRRGLTSDQRVGT
ncbi:hypothetical protein [Gimesia panareensis]|uniref:Uncharacterized protein n=1 Tax=Gimesia panareensis TaxID=2527978 RepID=A0A517QEE6_9PLAN|nr:hypothetical protein [Gimesia panareensis]QDT30020.1 hypothetical protein Enr10x_53790 [Gimesia panareensis]QDU53112.1 hypothetical protein Pan110_54960 [Gimesia panareensis]